MRRIRKALRRASFFFQIALIFIVAERPLVRARTAILRYSFDVYVFDTDGVSCVGGPNPWRWSRRSST
jgi:hypothetical protein